MLEGSGFVYEQNLTLNSRSRTKIFLSDPGSKMHFDVVVLLRWDLGVGMKEQQQLDRFAKAWPSGEATAENVSLLLDLIGTDPGQIAAKLRQMIKS